MSKALKCDRCEKCFDPASCEGENRFATIPEILFQNGTESNRREIGLIFENVNLCADCTRIFHKWILNFRPTKSGVFAEGGNLYDYGYYNGYMAGYQAGFNDGENTCQGCYRIDYSSSDSVYDDLGKGGGNSGTDRINGPDEAPERKKRTKKDGEHRE